MKQMMKQMGMDMAPIEDVRRIVITTGAGEYIFEEAEVVAVTMQGVTTYQISGQAVFQPAVPEIPEGDVRLVMDQTGAPEDTVRTTLQETGGDIAEAILRLTPHD